MIKIGNDMKLLLIDLTETKPKRIGTFTVEQENLNDNFLPTVTAETSKLLQMSPHAICVEGLEEGQDPLYAFKHFWQFDITIRNTNKKYTVIPE